MLAFSSLLEFNYSCVEFVVRNATDVSLSLARSLARSFVQTSLENTQMSSSSARNRQGDEGNTSSSPSSPSSPSSSSSTLLVDVVDGEALKSAVTEFVGELTKEPCIGLRHVSANVQKRVPQILDNTSSVQHVEKEVVNAFKYDAKYVFEDARNITKSETGERVEKLSQALENCIKALESN